MTQKMLAAIQVMAKKIRPMASHDETPIERGNVDLYAQPAVPNPDGGTSTVYSSSYNLDGQEVLLPAVTPGGRLLLTDDDIINEYYKTGKHLGKFRTPEAASAYADKLHREYENGKYRTRPVVAHLSTR